MPGDPHLQVNHRFGGHGGANTIGRAVRKNGSTVGYVMPGDQERVQAHNPNGVFRKLGAGGEIPDVAKDVP